MSPYQHLLSVIEDYEDGTRHIQWQRTDRDAFARAQTRVRLALGRGALEYAIQRIVRRLERQAKGMIGTDDLIPSADLDRAIAVLTMISRDEVEP